MKRSPALILSLVLLVSMIAACRNNSGDTPSPSTPAPVTGNGNGAATDIVDPEPGIVNFTFYDEDGEKDKPWITPVALEITALTGVELTYERPVGGADVMIPLMIAASVYPDLIYGKSTGSKQLLEANVLLKLDDYIDNSTYLKDFYGDLIGRMRAGEADPHIYSVGAYPIYDPKWQPSSEIGIQLAVLEEFGYPDVRTIYEIEPLLIDYKEKYPEIDGRPTFGFSLNNTDSWCNITNDWRNIINAGNPSGPVAGYPDHGEWIIEEQDLSASIKYLDPGVKEYFRWMNKMWNLGMIDPDSWTQIYDVWKSKITNGQVLALVSPNWQDNELEQSLRQEGLDNRTYARMPINNDRSTVSKIRYDFGWPGSWGVGITVACFDPDRAFAFLDWMCSDESQILRYWGIEGVHYEYTDGVRTQFPDVQSKRATDPDYINGQGLDWVYPFPERGNGKLDPTGNTYSPLTPETIIENYSNETKRALAAYDKTMWADFFPPPETWPTSRLPGPAWLIDIPVDTELNDFMHTIQHTLVPLMIPAAIVASPDQFDIKWDEFIQAINDYDVTAMHAGFTDLVRNASKIIGMYP